MKWRIGDVTITKIVELETTGGSRFILPQATPEEVKPIAWLIPHFADENGRLKMSIHALLIEAPGKRIIVDTCLGNDKQGRRVPTWNDRQGRFLDDLAAAGFPADSIDMVLCTHLHVDHVGWNTRLVGGKWVATFPHARYLFGRVEYEHWAAERGDPTRAVVFDDSVAPIMAAGLVDLVEMDQRLTDEIRLVPSGGHTPGHVCVHIASKGEEALITGDIAHHPCQMTRLDWASTADSDMAAAAATRRRIFGDLADKPVLVIGTHFAGPTAGRIVRDGDAYKMLVS